MFFESLLQVLIFLAEDLISIVEVRDLLNSAIFMPEKTSLAVWTVKLLLKSGTGL